jgi:hypothetical protein
MTSESSTSVAIGDVLHVVATPSCPVIRAVVTDNLRSADRLRWYPSLLLEGYDRDLEQRRLADDARLLGVPVVTTRSPLGRPKIDRLRMFFDDWFYLRNAHATVVHVHATDTGVDESPAGWLSSVARRTPILTSVFPSASRGIEPQTVTIGLRQAGRQLWSRAMGIDAVRETNWLYDEVRSAHTHERLARR